MMSSKESYDRRYEFNLVLNVFFSSPFSMNIAQISIKTFANIVILFNSLFSSNSSRVVWFFFFFLAWMRLFTHRKSYANLIECKLIIFHRKILWHSFIRFLFFLYCFDRVLLYSNVIYDLQANKRWNKIKNQKKKLLL